MRLLSLLLILTLASCENVTFAPIEEAANNPLAANGPELFIASAINFIPRGNSNRDVEFVYEHLYDELPTTLQNDIAEIRIRTPLRTIFLNLDRDRLYEQNYEPGEQVCYAFTFVSANTREVQSRETTFCFLVE